MNLPLTPHNLHQLFEQDAIEAATYRCGLDALAESERDQSREVLGCRSARELEQWRRRDVLHRQETLEDGAFA